MNFCKHFFFVAVAILVVFSRQSDAGVNNLITSTVSSVDDTLKEIFAKRDEQQSSENAKQHISQSLSRISNQRAREVMEEGIDLTIYYYQQSRTKFMDNLQKAYSLKGNSEAAIEMLNLAYNQSVEAVIASGATIYSTYGAATALSKPGAKEGLQNSCVTTTYCGEVLLNGISDATSIAKQGVTAGGDAFDQGILAAANIIDYLRDPTYKFIIDAADKGCDAVSNESTTAEPEPKIPTGTPESDKTVEEITNLAKKASSQAKSSNQLQAIEVVRDGFSKTAMIIGAAGKAAYNKMNSNKKILSKKATIAKVQNDIEDTKAKCVVAIAKAQQSLGMVAQIMDLKTKVWQSMITVEQGRVALMDTLTRANEIAANGITYNSQEAVLSIVNSIIGAAGYAAYPHISQAVGMILELILSE